MLQSTIDLSSSGPTFGQQAIAVTVIALGIALTAYSLLRSRYAGLPESLARRKADLGGARADAEMTPVYLNADEAGDRPTVRSAIRDAIAGTGTDPTTSTAVSRLREELVRTWAPRWERIPTTSRRIGSMAVVVLVFGAVAVSTEVLIGILSASGPGFNVAKWPAIALTETAAVIGAAGGAVSGAPVLGTLWALGFALAVTFWQWLFNHYYIAGGLLALGATAIAVFEKRGKLDGEPRWIESIPSPERVAKLGASSVAGLWFITLVGIGIGRTAGTHQTGVKYGLVMGATAIVVGLIYAAAVGYQNRSVVEQVFRDVRLASPDEQAYLWIRGGTIAFAAIVGPLIPVYIAVAVTKLPRLGAEFLAASIGVQAIVVLATVLVIVGIMSEAQDAWGDVRQALAISAARQKVRAAAVVGSLSVLVVGVVYVLIAGLSGSILLGVAVAIAAGLIVRTVAKALVRLRYRASGWGGNERTAARRVVIEGAWLEERTGEKECYVRVNGSTELLHPEQEAVVDAAADAVVQLVTDGEVAPSLEQWHADWSFDGVTGSIDETRSKLTERSRKRTIVPLRKHNKRVPVETVADKLEDIPDTIATADPDVTDELFTPAARRGILRVRDGYVELLNDVWSKKRRRS